MKKIIYITMMVGAFAVSGCKEQKQEIIDDNNAKGTEISEEDRNWQYDYSPSSKLPSKNFVCVYINPMEFSIDIEFISNFSDGMIAGPPPVTEELTLSGYGWKLDSVMFVFGAESDNDNIYSSAEFRPLHNTAQTISKFNELASKFNDITYNDRYSVGSTLFTKTDYINITCDQDFDQQHPKGTLLNDITEISYYWAKPFLDSKYQNRRLGDRIKSSTTELLTQFNEKKLDLTSSYFRMIIQNRPEKAGIYQFTITYKDVNGKTFSAQSFKIKLLGRE